MLDHLIQFDPAVDPAPGASFTPIDDAAPAQIVDAQVATSDWLAGMGVKPDTEALSSAQTATAQKAFAAMTTGATPEAQRQALVQLQAPESVKHLVAMLTTYDWAFVEQAKEIRGYTVAQIMEETKHPDAKVRLKALELLGKVTEVALFTDRVEVKKTGMTDAELDEELKRRLSKYAQLEKEVLGEVVNDDLPAA